MMNTQHGAGRRMPGMSPMGMSKEKMNQSMEILVQMALMYKMIEPARIVPSGDGIIAAFGNKIIKYDKDLNVVKEVNLDLDMDAMQKLASKLAKKYSDDVINVMGDTMSSGLPAGAMHSTSAGDEKEEKIKKEIQQIQ